MDYFLMHYTSFMELIPDDIEILTKSIDITVELEGGKSLADLLVKYSRKSFAEAAEKEKMTRNAKSALREVTLKEGRISRSQAL